MVIFSRHRFWTSALLAVIALAVAGGVARAHGDEMRVVFQDEPLGPYTLSVWVAPPELRPGEIEVAAAISEDGRPVPDCEVALVAAPLDHESAPIRAQAGAATAATSYRHEASLTLPQDGRYRFTITVRDPAGAGGQQQFDLFVRPVSAWVSVLIYAQLALAPLVGLWLLREGLALWRNSRSSRR